MQARRARRHFDGAVPTAPAAPAPAAPAAVRVSGGVNVLFRGDVGPYDAAVLHSTTSAELLKWLADNQFVVSDTARSIIEEYVALNKYFVAVKLLSGQETGAIQPVVLKFAGEVPCVPLKLTAIAALADMPVNLYVLGDSRAVPSNYFEITLNQAKIDWFSGGSNYSAMVSDAAERGGRQRVHRRVRGHRARDGHAAVAERRSSTCRRCRPRRRPPAFLQQVLAQNLLIYGPMLPLLRQYIPEPQVLIDMGITESQFYNNNATYWAQYQSSFAPFDPVAITAEVQTKIVDPLQTGADAVRLTRLPDPAGDVHLARGDDQGSGVRLQRRPPRPVQRPHRHRARHVRRADLHLLQGADPPGPARWRRIDLVRAQRVLRRRRHHASTARRRWRSPTCAPRPARDSP